MDIHYRAHEAQNAPTAVDFFSRKRMKTAGLVASASDRPLENRIRATVKEGEGSSATSYHESNPKDGINEQQKNEPHSHIALADVGGRPSFHLIQETTNQSRRRIERSNEGSSPCVGPCSSPISRAAVIEAVVPPISESSPLSHDAQASHGQRRKRRQPRNPAPGSRCGRSVSSADLHAHSHDGVTAIDASPTCEGLRDGHSHDAVIAVDQGSTSHAHQASPLSHDAQASQGQRRKRRQPRNPAPGSRGGRRVSSDGLHPHSHNGVTAVGEGSTSYAHQNASPTCEGLRDGHSHDAVITVDQGSTSHAHQAYPLSHDAQASQGQRRKRRQPRNPAPGSRVRRRVSSDDLHPHSHNGVTAVGEGSTSYAHQDASPTYEDLGDCIERCAYCDAAFWRGERLKGHTSSGGVPQYHLCCGGDATTLDPKNVQGLIHFLDAHNELVQIFRTARDKCAQADVPEFKIRLYSGDTPRGYELPASETLGAIVFDRGPESESNYDVVIEY
ncbi:helitron helicase-like domain-containing protein [Artemisia annua]|uniref:Helitron helicase-like domain-containing protein n=1 Tax=Artemisia annua TaxID=35608 RepID=A0A2U1L837_ARTAN|nr:helitron helicase-like domain-containing protein [Artemisia annua]